MATTAAAQRSTAQMPQPTVTLARYFRAVDVEMHARPGLRKGQTFFNVLLELQPDLAHRIEDTPDDPFYDDRKLPKFLAQIAEALR